MMKKLILYICVGLMSMGISGQNYHGTTGLLQVPSAEMDSAGTFRGGVSFLHKEFVPNQFGSKYNTWGYTIGLTAFRWIELSYSATLLKYVVPKKDSEPHFYNEDRHVNVRVRPLYEGRYWPAIVIGMDDVGRFDKMKSGSNMNNYYQNIYVAGTKHFDIKGWELGTHLAYRHYPSDKNKDRRGVAGGLTFRPAFSPTLRLIAEYDGVGVNVGGDVLLWRHWFAQAALVHGRGFMGGVSYHYTIKF